MMVQEKGKDAAQGHMCRRISRGGAPSLRAIAVRSLKDLREALRIYGLPANPADWLAADLSLGGWRAHQLGRSLLEQLGQAAPPEPPPAAPESRLTEFHHARMRDADLIGELVDAESKGNTGVIEALRIAEDVKVALANTRPRAVLILAPRFGAAWRDDDLACLRFLCFAMHDTPSHLILVTPDGFDAGRIDGFDIRCLNNPTLEQNAPLREIPLAGCVSGLVPASLAERVGIFELDAERTVQLADGSFLIDPSLRAPPSAALRRKFDGLGAIEGIDPQLRAFSQLHGSGYFADPGFLVRHSWRCFSNGCYEIALDFMQHAVLCAPDAGSKGRFLYELQGMRIALQKFDDARNIPAPDPSLPQEIRAGILLTKGWACVLSGFPKPARAYLCKALKMLHSSIGNGRQFLYLQNIYALSLVRTGAWEDALALEQQIEAALKRHAEAEGMRDWPMTYVNSLNQARLFKYRKDFERSRAYYSRGFATTLGARSESDAIYANTCMAKLFAEHGHVELAYQAWLRAALHWAGAEVPEALAMRVAASIVKHRTGPYDLIVDDIATTLTDALISAAEHAGRTIAACRKPAVFCRSDEPAPGVGQLMIGDHGWAVVAGAEVVAAPALASPPHDRLRMVLTGLLLSAAHGQRENRVRTVILPCEFSGELPSTQAESLLAAARRKISDVIFNERILLLAPEEMGAILSMRTIQHSPAVAGWTNEGNGALRVTFKRSRPSVILSDNEARLFTLAHTPARFDRIARDTPGRDAVENLEAKGILTSTAS